jgi:hypothetical protein
MVPKRRMTTGFRSVASQKTEVFLAVVTQSAGKKGQPSLQSLKCHYDDPVQEGEIGGTCSRHAHILIGIVGLLVCLRLCGVEAAAASCFRC